MKNTYQAKFSAISQNEIENLTADVKETIALEYNVAKEKSFTLADLWKVQHQLKSRVSRRFI